MIGMVQYGIDLHGLIRAADSGMATVDIGAAASGRSSLPG